MDVEDKYKDYMNTFSYMAQKWQKMKTEAAVYRHIVGP